jgi:hypothetical protein
MKFLTLLTLMAAAYFVARGDQDAGCASAVFSNTPLMSLLLRMTGIEVLMAAIAKTARPSFVPRTLRHRGTWLRTMIANPRHRRPRRSREPIH